MALSEELKTLAQLPRSNAPFLSLYLNTRWDSEKQRERVRIFVKTKLKECVSDNGGPTSGAGAEADAAKLEEYVRGLVNREWDEPYAGVAVFACSSLGVYQVVRSHVPFEDRFSCSGRPLLRPAAEQAHWGEPAVLASVAADAGHLMEFELGGVRREFSFDDPDFPGRHDQGGWSQARYQRHVDEHVHRNLKRLAEQLTRWSDERRVGRIALSGPDPLLSSFEEHLPKRIRGGVCARLHIEPTASPDAVQAEALKALDEAQARQDRQDVDALLDKGLGSGRASAGTEPVCRAAGSGKIRSLYLARDYRAAGWECLGCGALGVKVPLGCPVCGAPVESVELGEELIRGTLAGDGKVFCLEEHPGLRDQDGVAAALRY